MKRINILRGQNVEILMFNLAIHELLGVERLHIILLFSLEAERSDPHPHGYAVTIAMTFFHTLYILLFLSSHDGDLTNESYHWLFFQSYIKMHI